jgi:hypothetical protein
MTGISLTIIFFWEEQPGDCSRCKACKEEMYLKKYVGVLQTGFDRAELEGAICESCYAILENG